MSRSCTIDFGGDGYASLNGALTLDTVSDLYHAMEQHLRQNGSVVSLDLSAATVVDSAGLALLLEWQSTRSASGTSLEIGNAPSSLLRLAQLCDAVELLNLSGRSA